jgi:MFS family permease
VNGKRVTFTDVLRVREFRTLWLADAQSSIGDQVGRVALSVLVFERTSSAILTAVTYALTFLPAIIGGALLSVLADRLPRRRVMVVSDVARGLLFGGMALPGAPLLVLCVLLVLATLFEAPFSAAQSAMLPSVLTDHDQFVVGTGLKSITYQVAQLAGFAAGGALIALIGARLGLAVNAVSFAISGLMLMAGVRARPAARAPEEGDGHGWSLTAGARLIFTSPKLRALVGLSWLAGLYVVPEAVAAPYASKLDGGTAAVGLLMAAQPLGTALGTYLFVRWVPPGTRSRWMGPLGMAAGLPLICCVMTPPLPISLILWMLAGFFFCYQVQVVTEFIRAVPDHQRGQAVGIASSGLLAAQGIGVLFGGWVADSVGVGWSVGTAGVLGTLIAFVLAVMWSRARAATPPEAPTPPGTAEAADPLPAEAAPASAGPERRSARRRLVNAGQLNPNPVNQQHRHRA